VPTRIPEATIGEFVSNGIVFLLTVMPARSSAFSATLPVRPLAKTSISMRWLSVPPETSRHPSPMSVAASAFAFFTIWAW
jgi:hypothetical protein